MKREACVWQSCLYTADDAVLGVTLVFEGKTHTKARVPLCSLHLSQFAMTQRMTLRPEFLFAKEKPPGPNGSHGR